MGCGASSEVLPRKNSLVPPHSLVKELATPLQKSKTFEAIRKNDTFLVEKMLQQVQPLENLGRPGENLTSFHVAAQKNSFQAMHILLEWVKVNNPSDSHEIMNIRNSDGYNPVELCIINQSSETFYVLIDAKLIDLNYKNSKGEIISDLCRKYCFECLELLNSSGAQPDQNNETAIKEELVRNSDTIKDRVEKINTLAKDNETTTKEELVRNSDTTKDRAEKINTFAKDNETAIKEELVRNSDTIKDRAEKINTFAKDNETSIKEELVRNSDTNKDMVEKTKNFAKDNEAATKEKHLKKSDSIKNRVEKTKNFAKEHEIRKIPKKHNAVFEGIPVDSKVYKIMTELATNNKNFIDPEFKANIDSITTDTSHKHWNNYSKSVWKRPNELFKCDFSKIFLFDTIDPNDIEQGILGVCYLLSSLSALAEFPTRLAQIFINQVSNKFGVYGMKFFVKGVPTEIVVDDYIPCYGDRVNTPLFSKPKGNELWVMLLEKAWAKIFKNYAVCEAGYMEESLEYLLGTPAYRYMTKDQEIKETFNILSEADQKKYVICAATFENVTKAQGLVANHAYSIISVHDVGKYQIVKLRNPWGKFEWNGDFGDNSNLWTPELKNKIGFTNADDGVFCMKIQDFKKCFEFYSICVYNEGWEYSYLEVESDPKHADYFKFSVAQPTTIYLRIHQQDKRLYPITDPPFQYSSADITLARVEEDGTYCSLLTESEKNAPPGFYFGDRSIYPTKKFKLEIKKPGDYIIRTKTRWRHGKKDTFTLSAYAPIKIELEKIQPIKDFLPQKLKNLAQKSKERSKMNYNCSFASNWDTIYCYFYFENKGTKKWIADINFQKMKNVKLAKPFRKNSTSIHVEVKPGQSLVAFAKKIDVTGGGDYDWTWNEKFI